MATTIYNYDIAVIGAGHAGIEAALIAARMGAKTALLTMNADTVGQMSCNPAIGGVAKGQIVREIDALGGEMARCIDETGLQFRMLNSSKGAAMHSPRAQADKKAYQFRMKHIVENQENLTLRQETVEGLIIENGKLRGVKVRGDAIYQASAAIITTGTFLQAIMHTGESQVPGGRAGDSTTAGLSRSLIELGFELARFKTGTPARINGRTINFSPLDRQSGDPNPRPFSFLTDRITTPQMDCWLTATNQRAHHLIRANLHRAPMYSGQIQSRGPRYCPSIEDKVVRFANKESHQLFLEPEGRNTREYYINGISTSLPRDVQDEVIRSIRGLENAEIIRYGYAVEYDYAPPNQLHSTLETKRIEGLYFAGQLNGTTGYEEAAGQGLIAGINAALKLSNRTPLILDRNEAYLGVLIDDLVTKGVDEPYRMFTSRAEHRLTLRHDNADRRLTPTAYKLGCITRDRWQRFEKHNESISKAQCLLRSRRHSGRLLEEWLRRPNITFLDIQHMSDDMRALQLSETAAEQVEIETKYEGYINRQAVMISKQCHYDNVMIPRGFDFLAIPHLRTEAREKLSLVQPLNLGQASRISGITPADIAVVMLHIKEPKRLKQ